MFKLVGLATNVQVDTSQQKWTFTLDDATGTQFISPAYNIMKYITFLY
jgi:hypothetical protein